MARTFPIAGALLLAACLHPAAAHAAFVEPFDLATGDRFSGMQVAVDDAGNAQFVWERVTDTDASVIETRRRAADGALGSVQTVSAAGTEVEDPDVALDSAGNAHFVWRRTQDVSDDEGHLETSRVVETRRRAAGGTLGPITQLSPDPDPDQHDESVNVDLAVDPAGNAHFVWTFFDEISVSETTVAVQTRRREPDGDIGAIQEVAANATVGRLAIDANGVVHFAWRRGGSVETRRRSAAGTLGPVATLATGLNGRPEVAADAAGNTYVVWLARTPGPGSALLGGGLDSFAGGGAGLLGGGGTEQVQGRRRAADGSLGPTLDLSAVNPLRASILDVAADPAGNAHFSWGFGDSATTRRLAADGALGAERELSSSASGPLVGVDSAGNATFVWTALGSTQPRPQARRLLADGTLEAVEDLADEGSGPDLAVAPGGQAAAVWSSLGDEPGERIVQGAVSEESPVAITAAPSGLTSSTSATIEFVLLDPTPPPGRLECSLNGGDFTPCASPVSLTGLTDGEHVFQVRYHPDGEAAGSPTERRWTVDTTPPVVTIDSAPTGFANPPDATIAFHSSEPDGASFRCSLDFAAADACSSPASFIGLADRVHHFEVTAIDKAGNESQSQTAEWEVGGGAPSALPTCDGGAVNRVEAGVLIAVARGGTGSCLTQTQFEGRTVRSSPGPVAVNGIELQPTAGGRVIVDRVLANGIVATTTPPVMRIGSIEWELPARLRWTGAAAATTSKVFSLLSGLQGAPDDFPLDVGGLPVALKPSFTMSPLDGGSTTASLKIELPSLVLRSTPSPFDSGAQDQTRGLTTEFGFSASNDKGVNFNVKAKVASVWLLGLIELKDVELAYDSAQGAFEGGASMVFGRRRPPLPSPELRIVLGVGPDGFLGPLRKVQLQASNIMRPLGATGLFLQRLGGSFGRVANTLQAQGTVGLSGGPRIDLPGILQGEALSLDGSLTWTLPLGDQPWSIEAAGTEKLVEVPMIGGSVKYIHGQRIELKGKIDESIAGYGFLIEVRDAWLTLEDFNVEGFGEVNVPGLTGLLFDGVPRVEGVYSGRGMAVCIGDQDTRVGFGRLWGGTLQVFGEVCDVGPFRSPAPAAAQVGGARAITVEPGAKLLVVEAGSPGGPPKVLLTGPGGVRLETPTGPEAVTTRSTLLVQDPERNTTSIVLRNPRPGRYLLAPLPGQAAPLTVRTARELPPVQVKARVLGRGAKRTLSWTLRRSPGQRVTFVERGPAGSKVLANTNRRTGRVRFAPNPFAASAVRTIEAQVERNGLPRANLVVARYRHATRLRRVRRIRRRGAILSWQDQPAVDRYSVVIAGPRATALSRTTERASLRLPRALGRARLSVTLVPIDAFDRPGPRARVRLQPVPRRRARRR